MTVTITPKRGDSDPGTDDLSDGEIAIRKDVNPPKLFVRVGSNIREIGSGGGISGLGSTDNAILRANGTGGSTAQGSSLVIDDSANLTGANGITGATITASTKFVSDKLEAQNHGGSVMGFEFTDGFGSDDTIQISVGNAVRFAFVENSGTRAFIPWNDNDVNLGHSSYEFKNLYLDGTAFIDTLQLGATEITATGAELNILDGVTATASELNIMDGVTATTSELNIMDGVTATAAEINLIDGGTSRGTTAVANGDGFLHNDGGTMRMTNVSKMADLFAGTGIDASSAVLSVAAAQTGITSIFATDLKLGEDDQTKIDFETANEIQVYLNNAKDFTFSANTFTALSGSSIVVPAGGLTIGSTAVSATAAELNIMDGVTASTSELNIMDGVTASTSELNIMDGVTSTTAELNLMDGGTSATSTTLASADRFVCNDNGTMKQVALSDLVTYLEDGGTSGFNVDGGTYS